MTLNISFLMILALCAAVLYLREKFKAMSSVKHRLNGHIFKKMHTYNGECDPNALRDAIAGDLLTSEILNEHRWDEMLGKAEGNDQER